MRLFTNLFFLFVFFLSFSSSAQAPIEAPYRKGELLIQLKGDNTIEKFLQENSGYVLLETVSKSWNIHLLKFDHMKVQEAKVMGDLSRNPRVSVVQRNHKVELRSAFPDDTEFPNMWGLHNTGQSSGTPDADIDAPEAWEITTGGLTATGDTIVVAVIDGGFQLSHQDLSYWKNYGEIPGNGIDDDGNGYIDDVNGWNAYNNTGTITSDQHGTHVAGTIGAKGNNDRGVTGVNWNVKVMAIPGSSGNEATVVRAYSYAFDQRKIYDQTNGAKGAFVVATNASFGVDNGQPADFPLWCNVYDSLGKLGILNAGATANRNYNVDVTGDIPTACSSDWLISVTNTTRTDGRNSGAAFGRTTIDLGAPGTSILSTVPTNGYSALTGTSMATPHVAGTIALMWAAACPDILEAYRNDPPGVAKKMKEIMLNNVDVISALSTRTVSGGRLNAHKALLGVLDYCDLFWAPIVQNISVCRNEAFDLVADPGAPDREVYWYSDLTGSEIHIGTTLNVTGVSENTVFYTANYDVIEDRFSGRLPVYVTVVEPVTGISPDVFTSVASGSVNIWVTGGTSYSWSPTTGLDDPAISNPVASPSVTTSYTVTVTDADGCTGTAEVTVKVVDAAVPLPNITDQTVCKSTSFKLGVESAGPDYQVMWFNGTSPNPIHIGDTLNFSAISDPISVLVSNYNTVTQLYSELKTINVNVAQPITGISQDTTILKIGGEAQLWATGGVQYTWNPASSLNASNISNPIATPTATTNYEVIVRDQYNCVQIGYVKVTVMDNTGIAENSENRFKVYPVPTHEKVNFEFAKNYSTSDKALITVYNLTGKKVREYSVTGNKFVMERDKLPAGLYYYQFTETTGRDALSGKLIFVD
jgi:subtilisin family serine protease